MPNRAAPLFLEIHLAAINNAKERMVMVILPVQQINGRGRVTFEINTSESRMPGKLKAFQNPPHFCFNNTAKPFIGCKTLQPVLARVSNDTSCSNRTISTSSTPINIDLHPTGKGRLPRNVMVNPINVIFFFPAASEPLLDSPQNNFTWDQRDAEVLVKKSAAPPLP
ncbi:hypothetical protein ACOSP7_004357 [Xanthoceras sorbifolium]